MDYTIIYTKRKTLNITVERDRSIVVRAPHDTSEEKIAAVIEKKKLWLYQKVNHVAKYHPNPPLKEYVSGEIFLFLGHHYPLEIVDMAKEALTFEDKFILAASAKPTALQVFTEWYIQQANKIIPKRVAHYAQELGVTYKNVKIIDTKYRWGSCTPNNNIHFNWRIIKAPYYVIDYLIVHELAHLVIPNHTPEFWNLVSVVHADWQKGKDWLKEKGELL